VLHCVAACCNVFTVAPAPTCMCVYEEEYTHVAVCCSVLQCVAVWCCVLQCVAVCCSVFTVAPAPPVCVYMRRNSRMLQCVAVCCSVLQCAAVFHTHLFVCICGGIHVCCSILQFAAGCCSVFTRKSSIFQQRRSINNSTSTCVYEHTLYFHTHLN